MCQQSSEGYPAFGDPAALGAGRGDGNLKMCIKMCSQRGFPLLTKNIKSNRNQQRQRNGGAQNKRKELITMTIFKYDQS